MATNAAAVKDEQTAHRFAKDQLKAFVERVERLEEEKKATADDIKDVFAEAKGSGFDVEALRTVIRLRKQDVNERKESEAILETYLHALGMPRPTPRIIAEQFEQGLNAYGRGVTLQGLLLEMSVQTDTLDEEKEVVIAGDEKADSLLLGFLDGVLASIRRIDDQMKMPPPRVAGQLSGETGPG